MSALHVRGRVLVGDDDVRDELWVIGGRITYERPRDVTGTIDGWVLPGLVDAHCHIGMGPDGAVDRDTQLTQAITDRDAGTLLVRDAGSPADTRWIDARDDLPVIVRAGRHIARSRRYLRNFGHEIEPDHLVEYVGREARRGDGWVKLVGDWIDRETGDLAPCWPSHVLGPAIREAHRHGARVTAHCFGTECLPDLIDAGIDSIEHATGLTPELTARCAARGVAIVPTLINIDTFGDIAARADAKFPVYAAHLRDLHARRHATVAAAWEAGVPVYVGTDAGGTIAHGRIAEEVAELVRAGIPAPDAVAQATWRARHWLGRPGLTEGAPADFVVYDADPRADVGVLARPRRVLVKGVVVAG